MVDENELERWREALAEEPTGWDFSTLTGYREQDPPWHYETVVGNLLPTRDHVLDLGTGGGELLASLASLLPDHTVATEGWPPNLSVARERLAEHGIEVHDYDADRPGSHLPFEDDTFDLVLSRHEAFDADEVARVLAPDGVFLTQQVGGDDLQEIDEAFGRPSPHPEVTLTNTVHLLVRAGLTVERSDAFHGCYEFDDMVSLLRYLRRVPWHAPTDLGAETHREVLGQLAARMQDAPLTATASRFIVVARAPVAPDPGRTDFSELLEDELEVPKV